MRFADLTDEGLDGSVSHIYPAKVKSVTGTTVYGALLVIHGEIIFKVVIPKYKMAFGNED